MSLESKLTPVETKELHEEEQSPVFEGTLEAIQMYGQIGKELAEASQAIKDGEVSSIRELEGLRETAINLSSEKSFNSLESRDSQNMFALADLLLNPETNPESLEKTTPHSLNTLLEMAWEVREKSKGTTIDKITEGYMDKYLLNRQEAVAVAKFAQMQPEEFDKVQRALLDSGLSFAIIEATNNIIESNELPLSYEEERSLREIAEQERLNAKEEERKEREWTKVHAKLLRLYPELSKNNLVRQDLEWVLPKANQDREEVLALLTNVGGVELEDMPELVEPYTADNLENSQWILGFLLENQRKYNIYHSSSDKYNDSHDQLLDMYTGEQLTKDRKTFLKSFIKIYSVALTDPKSKLHSEAISTLFSLGRETSTDLDDEAKIRIGSIAKEAFNKHYTIRIFAETGEKRAFFNTKKAKMDFKELWDEYIEKGELEIKRLGSVATKKVVELKNRLLTNEARSDEIIEDEQEAA